MARETVLQKRQKREAVSAEKGNQEEVLQRAETAVCLWVAARGHKERKVQQFRVQQCSGRAPLRML